MSISCFVNGLKINLIKITFDLGLYAIWAAE